MQYHVSAISVDCNCCVAFAAWVAKTMLQEDEWEHAENRRVGHVGFECRIVVLHTGVLVLLNLFCFHV